MPRGNQTGSVETRSGKLRLVFYVEGRKVHEITELRPTKEGMKAAHSLLKRRIAEVELGEYQAPAARAPKAQQRRTFAEYGKTWVASLKGAPSRDGKPFKPSSVLKYERLLRRWNLEIGDRELRTLTKTDMVAASVTVLAGMKPNTRTGLVMIAKKMLRAAVADGLVKPDVPEWMKTPTYQKRKLTKEDVWSVEEAARLPIEAAKIDPTFGRMVALDLRLGIRGGELRSLRLEDIDMTRWTLKVERTASEDYMEGDPTGDVKTERSQRSLDFADQVKELLREQVRSVLGKSEWLFPSHLDTNLPMPYWKWHDWHEELWKRMGKRLPPHRLRHTFASVALTGGATLHEVAAYMGDTHATVEGHYAAWTEEEARKKAARRFGSMYDSSPIHPQGEAQSG